MDRLERLHDPVGATLAALDGRQAGMWTAMPGKVISFDPSDTTCSVQLTIQLQVLSATGDLSWVTISPLIKCPVVLPGGGGFVVTLPIQAGDEVLVVFASRCIDSWWQSGNVGPQVEMRMHDLSDGFVIPGPRSVPKAISGYSTSAVEVRSESGAVKLSLSSSGITLKGKVTFEDDVDFNGAVKNLGINIGATHTHSGVRGGTDTSGPPTP